MVALLMKFDDGIKAFVDNRPVTRNQFSVGLYKSKIMCFPLETTYKLWLVAFRFF